MEDLPNTVVNDRLVDEIKALKCDRNAIILSHNYQRSEIQDIADYVGDSLELALIAAKAREKVVVFCGVSFMAETCWILSPEKTVLLPVEYAGCALAEGVNAEQIRQVRQSNPDTYVITYVNSSAEVKAESDICCTSGNVLEIIRSADTKRPLLLVPDRCLGSYAAWQTGCCLRLWAGSCPVHLLVSESDVAGAKSRHPYAKIMVHPECRMSVLRQADCIAGTSGMLAYARAQAPETQFLVGTEIGLMHRLKKENPGKVFFPISEHLVCPSMKLIGLEDVLSSLEHMQFQVKVAESIQEKASNAIEAMLEVEGHR